MNLDNLIIRPLQIQPGFLFMAQGSALVTWGRTRVLCSAQLVEGSPSWKVEQGVSGGWITAEYGMLPGSTLTRKSRERQKTDSRSIEIQRLIGRSLRAAVDLEKLGERTIYIDCDVLDADGGTRCAAITGGWVALYQACHRLTREGVLEANPVDRLIAAISVGMREGEFLLDLDYEKDSTADVDLNVVMTESEELVEIQGTGERRSFTREQLNIMLEMAWKGIQQVMKVQKEAVRIITLGG